MLYAFGELAAILQAKILLQHHEGKISQLAYDSRVIDDGENTLFFAIRAHHDGHHHLQECYIKGVRNFVIEDKKALKFLNKESKANSNILLVKNSVQAMQKLAAYHRSKFQIPIIGITGSNGKTIVKEWLYELLKDDYYIIRSPKSYNSQIGVPFSVLQINEKHGLGIFEAGISQTDEMQNLEPIIQPTIGILTNVLEAHQAQFQSRQQKAWEKLKLFIHSDVLIYCKDDSLIESLVDTGYREGFFKSGMRFFSWSQKGKPADLQVSEITEKSGSTFLKLTFHETTCKIKTPLSGQINFENIIHCCAVMLYLGYELAEIKERIPKLQPLEMRLEMKAAVNGSTLINDSYNSDLYALSIALDTLNQQNQHNNKVLILSDILQSGRTDEELYHLVAKLCQEKNVNRFIGIGKSLSGFKNEFPENALFYENTEDFLKRFPISSLQNAAILLKGSRSFGFEKIASRLQQKAHDTVLEINLNAIIHNLKIYKGLLKKDVKIMAMVKAFSYGSGSFEIANILQYHKVDYLAVAYTDEGVALRQNGIKMPIMVMNPSEDAFLSMLENNLEPEIYNLRLLNALYNAIQSHEHSIKAIPIHIKLDTGMHRLGFMENEMGNLIAALDEMPGIFVQSIFTHLASADVEAHDVYTKNQLKKFNRMSKQIAQALGYMPLRHVLNSSGISRFPKVQYEMVRLGIGLYGIDPSVSLQEKLEEVSSLSTHISQIKHLKAGEAIGYSRKTILNKDSVIATIGIGYADGYSRLMSNGVGKVLIHGKLAPIVGNICMDMSMIDITGIAAEEGDEVILFGKGLSVNEVASAMQTIPYEVLTHVSQRVKRVYYKE